MGIPFLTKPPPFFGWPTGRLWHDKKNVASSAQRALRCCFSWRKNRLTDARWTGPEDLPLTIGIRRFIPSFTHVFLVICRVYWVEKSHLASVLQRYREGCGLWMSIKMRCLICWVVLPAPKNGVFCFKKFFIIMIHNVSFTATKPRK